MYNVYMQYIYIYSICILLFCFNRDMLYCLYCCFILIERCAPFLLCKQCAHCKEQGTLKLVPSNETCIVITCGGKFDCYQFS